MSDVDPKLIEQYKNEMLRLQRRSMPISAAERPWGISAAAMAQQPEAVTAAAQQPEAVAAMAQQPEAVAAMAQQPEAVTATAEQPAEITTKDEPEESGLEDDGGTGQPAAEDPENEEAAIPAEDNATAYFQAQVFAGRQAIPIRNARVILKRDGMLVAFLLTDENGQTRVIATEAPPRANTLEPGNANKTLDYRADISAEGFTPLRNLLVSQVGGGRSLLNVNLVPSPEGVSE